MEVTGSRCNNCAEFISDLDAGFSPATLGMSHKCGGEWVAETRRPVAGKPESKRGRELEVGDVMTYFGESHTITGFGEHPGLDGSTARVLNSGEFGITVFDDDLFRLTSSGTYISSHLWWHHERKG